MPGVVLAGGRLVAGASYIGFVWGGAALCATSMTAGSFIAGVNGVSSLRSKMAPRARMRTMVAPPDSMFGKEAHHKGPVVAGRVGAPSVGTIASVPCAGIPGGR